MKIKGVPSLLQRGTMNFGFCGLCFFGLATCLSKNFIWPCEREALGVGDRILPVFFFPNPQPIAKIAIIGATMIEVEVRGDIEQAIRVLKKKLQLDGIKKELKRREYYEKPSVKRRRKQAESRRKLRKL